MRKYNLYLLLALFLFTGKAMYGYSAEKISSPVVTGTVAKDTHRLPYSIEGANEFEISFTHSVSGNTQQVSVKKLPGYPTIQQLLILDRCLAKSFPFQNADNAFTPPHLTLIYPFHYFW